MEYRPGGEFFSTIVQKGMPIVMLGKWMMTNNAITQIDTSILTADKRLNPVDNETNHILSWTANQMVIVGEWAGMTTVVERVDKQIYLGRNATSDSKVLENTLRRYLQSRR